MNPNALDVFVFSYNRGIWLNNLLLSINDLLAPPLGVRLHVFDDHSNDPKKTLQVLKRLRAQEIHICHATDFDMQGRGSRGGLHAGIEAALARVARKGSLAL